MKLTGPVFNKSKSFHVQIFWGRLRWKSCLSIRRNREQLWKRSRRQWGAGRATGEGVCRLGWEESLVRRIRRWGRTEAKAQRRQEGEGIRPGPVCLHSVSRVSLSVWCESMGKRQTVWSKPGCLWILTALFMCGTGQTSSISFEP